MDGQKTFGTVVQSYLGGMVTDRRNGSRIEATQKRLAGELPVAEQTLTNKLKGKMKLTDNDIYTITSTLIHWGRITRLSQLQELFELAGYTLPEKKWLEEPWNSLPDDTLPLKQPELLPLQNWSFDEWKDKMPVKWLCNKKTGDIKQVRGRESGSALEISGNRDNQHWVYCRTRETQDIPVVPGSKIRLSFWARLLEDGKNPGRERNVEVAYYVDDAWKYEFSLELTDRVMDDTWQQYSMEWWDVPLHVDKIAVGVVVRKDGAFQVDDIALHMRTDK